MCCSQVAVPENQAGGGDGGGAGFDFGGLLNSFTGNQQSGLKNILGTVLAGGLEKKAMDMGCDPALIKGVMGLLGIGGAGAGAAAAGGDGGGGGVNMGNLANVAMSLTKGGNGGGSSDGFMSLINSLAGGGSGGSGGTNNVLTILIGLVKSFFNMQAGKNKSLQDWGDAGAKKDDDGFGRYGDNLVNDLINPGKKDKDRIDDDPHDKDTGGNDNVKGWFDNHPEIGKMQKDVFDDVFDTTDEDDEDRLDDDPTPLIPAPKGFEGDCSDLDQASILFLNTKILLDLRKEWRFLFSTKSHGSPGWSDFFAKVELKGPTIVVMKSGDQMFGMFTSTSWADSEGGWIGNGDSFVFSLKPKMGVFYATGKDDNILHCSPEHGLAMGGTIGRSEL